MIWVESGAEGRAGRKRCSRQRDRAKGEVRVQKRQKRTDGQREREKERQLDPLCLQQGHDTLAAFSSAERRLSSDLCSSSSTWSLESSVTRNCFSNCTMSSSNYVHKRKYNAQICFSLGLEKWEIN